MRTSELKVIELPGSPRENGRIHGETLADEIRTYLERLKEDIASRHGMDLKAFAEGFLQWSGHWRAVEQWAPDLAEEVTGIAEGAGLDETTARLLQHIDEQWVYGTYVLTRRKQIRTKCTGFAVLGGNGQATLAGQNMDIPKYHDGLQVLLRTPERDDRPAAFVFTSAGIIGMNGMNAAPLGVTCNTLMRLTPSADGLPVAFVVRKLLQCNTFEQAEAFLREVPHASGQNYILSTPDRVASFECSSRSVAEFRPLDDGTRVCHTNHPLANRDLDEFVALQSEMAEHGEVLRPETNSRARYVSIHDRLGRPGMTVSVDRAKAALSAHDDAEYPVSVSGDPKDPSNLIGFTAGSVIYELDTERPVLHLAPGPPCSTPYKTFSFHRN
jgi:predicted choloylglycine hydrolase